MTMPIVCNRRIFGAVKALTDDDIKELQELAEANRRIPHWHRRGVRLIKLKRARQSRKVG
jgi:hypothetical protein